MTRNLKIVLASALLSIPLWWGIDLFSQFTTHMLLNRELKTNPEILAAYAAQEQLGQKLLEAYPLTKKNTETLVLDARGASSTLVKEDGSTKPLFAQEEEKPVLIASLTKLMTAFVAMEQYAPTQNITITPELLLVDGESGQLKPWEVFPVRDLLYVALIESSNDAATALTQPMGYAKFIDTMNTEAAKLGMQTASFENPTGLDADTRNLASPRDLTKLAIHLKKNYPQVFDILSQQQFPLYTPAGTFHHTLINTNELLGYKEWPAKVLGGKTGWTPQAKQSLLLVVQSPDKQGYIVHVILGSGDRFGEMKKQLAWILDSYQWNQ